MGIFSDRKKALAENPLIAAIDAAADSVSLGAALTALYNAADQTLITAETCDLLLEKSALCNEVICASWYGCAFAWFCREEKGRDIAAPRLRVRDTLFEFALKYCTTADSVRCITQAFCNIALSQSGKLNTSVPEARQVFKALAAHANSGEAVRYLCTWMNNCCTIDEGKINFGHSDVVDGLILASEQSVTTEAVQWLASAVANCNMLEEPRVFYFRDDFIEAIFKMVHLPPTLSPDTVRYYFVMTNNLTLSQAGREIFVRHGKSFHDAVIRLADFAKTDPAVRYLCTTICNCTIIEEGKIEFASDQMIAAYAKLAPFVEDVMCARYFGTAISNTNSATNEVKEKFACRTIIKALTTAARVVYYSREGKFAAKDRAEAVRWINSAVSNISMCEKGQVAFGCPEYAECWARLCPYAKSNEAVRFSAVALNNIGISATARPFFATDSVVEGFRALSHFVEKEDAAQYWSSAIANLAIDDDIKLAFSQPSMLDAFIRVAKCATSPDAVRYTSTAMSNLCSRDGPGREVFASPEIVDEFLVILARHAVTSEAAQWVVSLISNTTLTKRARMAYHGSGETIADIYLALAPFCREPVAVRYFCTSINNLCIEAPLRQYFCTPDFIEAYTMLTKFVNTKESARYWSQSQHNIILGKPQQDFYACKEFKNALCCSALTSGSCFLTEPESATWWINTLDVLFTDPNNRAPFRTSTFRRVFDQIKAVALRTADATLQTKATRCTGDLNTGFTDADFANDEDEIERLIEKIESSEDPNPDAFEMRAIRVGTSVDHREPGYDDDDVDRDADYDDYDDGVDDEDEAAQNDAQHTTGVTSITNTTSGTKTYTKTTAATNTTSSSKQTPKAPTTSDTWIRDLIEKHKSQLPSEIPDDIIHLLAHVHRLDSETLMFLDNAHFAEMQIPIGPRINILKLIAAEHAARDDEARKKAEEKKE